MQETDFRVGDRAHVRSHTDAYLNGDRYGTVTKVKETQSGTWVTLQYQDGRTRTFPLGDLMVNITNFQCEVGDRVQMTGLMNDPDPIPVGECGTVRELCGSGELAQIDVVWDSGRTLYLLPGDPFRVI